MHSLHTHPHACLPSHLTRSKVSLPPHPHPQRGPALRLPRHSDSPVAPPSVSSSLGQPRTRCEGKPERHVSRQHLRGHLLWSARRRASCISVLACRGRAPRVVVGVVIPTDSKGRSRPITLLHPTTTPSSGCEEQRYNSPSLLSSRIYLDCRKER